MSTHLNAGTPHNIRALCGEPKADDTYVERDYEDPFHDRVTCEGCRFELDAVKRVTCLMLDPDDHLGITACSGGYGHHGGHDWELVIRPDPLKEARRHAVQREAAESSAAVAQREADSIRESEERRHPELVEPVEASTPSGRLWGRSA